MMYTAINIADVVKSVSLTLQIPVEEFKVGGSGAFVLLGRMEYARDIDIEVTQEIYSSLAKRYPTMIARKTVEDVSGKRVVERLVAMRGDLEIYTSLQRAGAMKFTETNGITHYDLESAIRFKKALGRDKDINHLREMNLL